MQTERGIDKLEGGPGEPWAIVYDPQLLDAPRPHHFDPQWWDDRASGGGGRGSAIRLRASAEDWMLKHYRRGGQVARLSRDRYLFTGHRRSRGFREFDLLHRMRALDLPVPPPVAALSLCRGLLNGTSALITRAIPDARAFSETCRGADPRLWRDAGRTIAWFHRAGVHHPDLNIDNILVDAGGGIWLLDFDRGRLGRPSRRRAQAGLRRLHRSLRRADADLGHWPELVRAWERAFNAP